MLDAYTHVGGLATRMDQLPVTVAALLVADACNVGLVPVIHAGHPALSRDRLSHVDQNYIRPDTHTAANARLVDYQAGIGITDLWGGGLVASVDGLRFRVPVQSIHAAPSPRYFDYKRGITWLNAVNDRFATPCSILTSVRCRRWWPPIPPATPTSSSACSGCWATGSPRASPTWAAPGSGAPTYQASRPGTTGR
jgi:hypothetical protein